MAIITALRDSLINDEAIRLKPYRDSVGKLTIGVGRNLDDVGISRNEAMAMLDNDIARVLQELTSAFPWYTGLNDARKVALANMCFNLGLPRLQGFTRMLIALEAGQYTEAADEMLNSKWAGQVGNRARRLASLVRTGVLP